MLFSLSLVGRQSRSAHSRSVRGNAPICSSTTTHHLGCAAPQEVVDVNGREERRAQPEAKGTQRGSDVTQRRTRACSAAQDKSKSGRRTADAGRGRGPRHDRVVSHTLITDPASEVAIQTGAVVSKVVHRGEGVDVTVFGFDSGEQLTEHQAARAAVVQVLSGRLQFTVDNEQLDLGPGSWLHMSPGAPHSLIASEPTVMLLTLIAS